MTVFRSNSLLWAYMLVALLLVFFIPTLIPGKFVASDSYVFGYNNRVGFGLVVLFTGAGVFFFRKRYPYLQPLNSSDTVGPGTFWTCVGLVIAVGIGMYFLTARLGSFGESTYFINRIELTARGLHQYRDFEFAYGAGFIYVPLFLSHLLHLSIPNAYYLFWILCLIAGTYFLSQVVTRIDYPGGNRNTIFTILFAFTLVSATCAGVNYTSFRFAAAPLAGILLFNAIRDGKLRGQMLGSFFLVFFTILLLLISPEIAITFALGTSIFIFVFYWGSTSKIWLLIHFVTLALLALVLIFANQFQAFETLRAFSTGGMNFPIIPSLSILLFLFSLFICARIIEFAFSHGCFRKNHICLLFIAFPMLAPALGRCDPGHLFWNGLVLLLLCLLWASNNQRAWVRYRFAFVSVFIVLGFVSSMYLYKGEFGRAIVNVLLSRTSGAKQIDRTIDSFLTRHLGNRAEKLKLISQQDASLDYVQLPSGLQGPAEAPFGYFLSHNPASLKFGYYWGTLNALDSTAVARKISELSQVPHLQLMLPENFESACVVTPEESRRMISVLFVYPYTVHVAHSRSVYQPLCAYIRSHYVLTRRAGPETYDYQIWSPKY